MLAPRNRLYDVLFRLSISIPFPSKNPATKNFPTVVSCSIALTLGLSIVGLKYKAKLAQ